MICADSNRFTQNNDSDSPSLITIPVGEPYIITATECEHSLSNEKSPESSAKEQLVRDREPSRLVMSSTDDSDSADPPPTFRDKVEPFGIKVYEKWEIVEELQGRDDIKKYLAGDLTPGRMLQCQLDQLPSFIYQSGTQNARYVWNNIEHWTVPPFTWLIWGGVWDGDIRGMQEQIRERWDECDTMGWRRPRPDYLVSPSKSHLSEQELQTIAKFHTRQTPLQVNSGALLPFLICTTDTRSEGLVRAERSNIHAGAIVVRAWFRLYQAAGIPVTNLAKEILVWSVDVIADTIRIHGHYGRPFSVRANMEGLEIYRHRIADIRLLKPEERFVPFNFVRNIYNDFAPLHLKRLKDALSDLAKQDSSTRLVNGSYQEQVDSAPPT